MAAMAGCGLPGFANFPGELLTLFGAWKNFAAVRRGGRSGGALVRRRNLYAARRAATFCTDPVGRKFCLPWWMQPSGAKFLLQLLLVEFDFVRRDAALAHAKRFEPARRARSFSMAQTAKSPVTDPQKRAEAK